MVESQRIAPQAVIYVTGAPGTGKSTLVRALARVFANVEVFSYGSRMAQHLGQRSGVGLPDELLLRGGTDLRVTIDDIRAVDRSMVEWVKQRQAGRLLLIDTHQVTLEKTGLRFVPFESQILTSLQLTMIWLVSAPATYVVDRTIQNPMGRIVPTIHEAEVHALLQSTVASQYAITKGIELRLLNGERAIEVVLAQAISCLEMLPTLEPNPIAR